MKAVKFGCAKSQNLARLHVIAKLIPAKSPKIQNQKILYSQIIVTIRYLSATFHGSHRCADAALEHLDFLEETEPLDGDGLFCGEHGSVIWLPSDGVL